ncbi:hypothetical protein EV646_108249 [Kribbella antiqua]|uniref:Uncharacterized protein n=1 Tax=Kribbella antiqua TaxID=2512217 RepID=A0A4R2IMM5_9ACTN|nr:hypothetical protein EV646_108249 [Kribbella antiqua]
MGRMAGNRLAGLRVERLAELPVDLRGRHPRVVEGSDGLWRIPGDPIQLLLTCLAGRP